MLVQRFVGAPVRRVAPFGVVQVLLSHHGFGKVSASADRLSLAAKESSFRTADLAPHERGVSAAGAVCAPREKSQKVCAVPRHPLPRARSRITMPLKPVVNTNSALSARNATHHGWLGAWVSASPIRAPAVG